MTYRIICDQISCDQNCVKMVSAFVSSWNGIWMIQVSNLRSSAVVIFFAIKYYIFLMFTQ